MSDASLMRAPGRKWRETGFTLVELMIAISVLLVGVLGSVALVDGANRTSSGTKAREGATNLARDVIEGLHNIPIQRVVAVGADLPTTLKNGGIGGTVGASGWQVSRRGFTYTVQTSACAFDDPHDGTGTFDTSSVVSCSGSTSGTTDSNPFDYARVTVVVSWTDHGGTHQVRQAAVLNNTSDGPAITAPVITSPPSGGAPVFTDPAVVGLSFQSTTDQAASSASWYLNGTYEDAANGSNGGTTWKWTWDLKTATGGAPCSPGGGGVLDGTYLVGAQAFDTAGLSAGQKALTVTLNRCPPLAPTGLLAVRPLVRPNVAELTWDTNKEADVLGYYVYRRTGSGYQAITSGGCSGLIKVTQCSDTTDPGGSVSYEITAVDKDPSKNLRPGDYSPFSAPAVTNTQPSPPTGILSNGVTSTLKFTTPASPQDPDSSDYVDHFDIYRDGQTVADRYATVDNTGVGAGSTLTWTDSAAGTGTHTYWVTAVDSHGAESPWNGSVTR